jgi:hypothetical protein
MLYATALIAKLTELDCIRGDVEYANWLFSMTRMLGSLKALTWSALHGSPPRRRPVAAERETHAVLAQVLAGERDPGGPTGKLAGMWLGTL